MSEFKHVYELIGNDPYNIKILNETLWDIKEMVFDNLYKAQRSLTDILRFDFNMNNYSLKSFTEITYNIKANFISHNGRTKFRTSDFYKKELTPNDITSNPEIFNNNVLVFINGELHTNFTLYPNEDITTIKFKIYDKFNDTPKYVRPGFTKAEINDLIESKANMTVYFVKHHLQGTANINRMTLNNYALVDQYLGLPLVEFTENNKLRETTNFLTMVNADDLRLYKYRLLTTDLVDGKVYFNPDEVTSLTNTYTYLQNLYLPYYMDRINIPADEIYFELPIKDMPVPVENILVFRKSDNAIYYDHKTTLTLHYSNIYKIDRATDDELVLFIYYADDTISTGSKYQNEISLYYRFVNNVLEKYKDETIPDIIKNYSHDKITYTNKDLISSNLDHLDYKFDKLNNMIRRNGNYYSIYLDKLVGYVPTFYVDVSQINNLGERYRTNNHSEIKDIAEKLDFETPCYLFTFRHHSNHDKIFISIDEYHRNDYYSFYDEKYLYVYLPTHLVNTDSIITVEKFVDYRYHQQIDITDNTTYHKLNIPDFRRIQASDIYIATRLVTKEEVYLSKNDYKLYSLIDGKYVEITRDNDFYNYKNLYVKFINSVDIGTTVNVHIDRLNFKEVQIADNEFIINKEINNDDRNILLFRNGQLIPKYATKHIFSENIAGVHTFKALLKTHFDDEFTLVYNTNKYFLVHYAETINEKGLVDLTGLINKPLDFKWYDIYLNGMRLNDTNVEILGPYIMLISGVNSIKNLEIYQKNLDSYKGPYDSDDTSSKILDEILEDILDDLEDIEDTMPDILDDLLIDYIGFLDQYLFSLGLLNPDIQQITDRMLELYPLIFDDKKNFFMNGNFMNKRMENNIFLNPDTNSIIVD